MACSLQLVRGSFFSPELPPWLVSLSRQTKSFQSRDKHFGFLSKLIKKNVHV